jgi:hypothetical protein
MSKCLKINTLLDRHFLLYLRSALPRLKTLKTFHLRRIIERAPELPMLAWGPEQIKRVHASAEGSGPTIARRNCDRVFNKRGAARHTHAAQSGKELDLLP